MTVGSRSSATRLPAFPEVSSWLKLLFDGGRGTRTLLSLVSSHMLKCARRGRMDQSSEVCPKASETETNAQQMRVPSGQPRDRIVTEKADLQYPGTTVRTNSTLEYVDLRSQVVARGSRRKEPRARLEAH